MSEQACEFTITLDDATQELRAAGEFPGFEHHFSGRAPRYVFNDPPMSYDDWKHCLEFAAWVYGAWPYEVLDTLDSPAVGARGLFAVVQAGMALGYDTRYRTDNETTT